MALKLLALNTPSMLVLDDTSFSEVCIWLYNKMDSNFGQGIIVFLFTIEDMHTISGKYNNFNGMSRRRRDAVIDLKEGRSPVYEEQSNVEIITAKGHPTPPQNRGNPGSSPSIDLYGRPVSPNYWSEHLDDGERKEDCEISTCVRVCVKG